MRAVMIDTDRIHPEIHYLFCCLRTATVCRTHGGRGGVIIGKLSKILLVELTRTEGMRISMSETLKQVALVL